MLSHEQVDELITRLDHSEGTGTGSYWQMLMHAEKNDFDLAVIKIGLHSALASELHDLPKPESDLEERDLVLRLRDKMRESMRLPQLSETERANWRWEAPKNLRQYKYTGPPRLNDQPGLTKNQITEISSYIHYKYPEVVRYLNSVRKHNEPLGFNGGSNDHFIVRQAWHSGFMMDAICEVIGEQGDLWVSYFEIEQEIAPFY